MLRHLARIYFPKVAFQCLTVLGMGEKVHEIAVKPELSSSVAVGSAEIHFGFKSLELGVDAWRFVFIIFLVRGTGPGRQ